MKATTENTITITLTRKQAEALEWIADYGIDEKECFLGGAYNDYNEQ
jgi:hypothetical protein